MSIMTNVPLPTVNDLSVDIVVLERDLQTLVEKFTTKFGISVRIVIAEDDLKLGLYKPNIFITKINGVKTDGKA